MNTVNTNMTAFDAALQKSCTVRSCSYSPLENFEPVMDEFGERKILSLPYKLLWFHTYCNENGMEGHVEADDFSLVSYPSSGNGSDSVCTAIVTARAKVYINGKIVATASAGKSFVIGNTVMMDGAIQAASGSALSRALSNAGFGCISAAESPESPAPTQPETLPFSLLDSTVPPMSSAASFVPPSQPTIAPPPVHQPVSDPVADAKAMVWGGRGIHNGKMLGEILATSPNTIIWIAESWSGTGPIKDAAMVLLEEAKKRCGK